MPVNDNYYNLHRRVVSIWVGNSLLEMPVACQKENVEAIETMLKRRYRDLGDSVSTMVEPYYDFKNAHIIHKDGRLIDEFIFL